MLNLRVYDEALIRRLYPGCSDEELELADARIYDYLLFTVRLYDSIRADPIRYARFKQLIAERRHKH